jgi:hypothetical protein
MFSSLFNHNKSLYWSQMTPKFTFLNLVPLWQIFQNFLMTPRPKLSRKKQWRSFRSSSHAMKESVTSKSRFCFNCRTFSHFFYKHLRDISTKVTKELDISPLLYMFYSLLNLLFQGIHLVVPRLNICKYFQNFEKFWKSSKGRKTMQKIYLLDI